MAEHRTIDRETYRSIKKMSRDEMQAFLVRYYENAVNDYAHTLDLELLRSEIGQISGIGEKRLNEIMSVIEKHLNNEEATTE